MRSHSFGLMGWLHPIVSSCSFRVAYRVPHHHHRIPTDRQSLARARSADLQRINTLKDIGRRLLGVADTAHVDIMDKLLAQAAYLNDTAPAARGNYFKIQPINLFLRQYGFGSSQTIVCFTSTSSGPVRSRPPGLTTAPQGWRGIYVPFPLTKGHLPRLVGRVVRSGGVLEWAVPRAKKLATETKAKINEAIVELREEISIAPWRSLTARRHGEHPS